MATDGAGALLALLDDQELALRDLEDTAAASASAPLRAALAAILARALTAAAALPDGADWTPLLNRVKDELLALNIDASTILLGHFGDALEAGVVNADAQLPDDPMTGRGRRLTTELRDVAADADVRAFERIRAAVTRMTGISTVPQLVAGLAVARQAVSSIERAAAFGVNRAVATGADRVAAANGADRLWISERDACLHCAKYAGQVAAPGVAFPGGLTFDSKPLSRDPVPSPPLHPWCRCRTVMYRPSTERPGEVSLPDALKREARRSVARGFSLPSESEARRLAATDRLLREGAGLPKTVEAAARRAVDRGGYPRGRNVPK